MPHKKKGKDKYSYRGGGVVKESRGGIADADTGGRMSRHIEGGYGPYPGDKGMYPTKKYKKRKGYDDHGDAHYYEDGGIVGLEAEAKRAAIKSMRDTMGKLGGRSLTDNLEQKFAHGGIVAKISAKDPESFMEGLEKAKEIMEHHEEMEDDYDEMSKEELIEMLKRR